MTTKIGKIKSISFGFGGYQDAMLGLSIQLGSDKDSWGVHDFKGGWGPQIEWSDRCKWTEADRAAQYAECVRFIGKLLTEANKDDMSRLVNVPVEVQFDGNTLKSWRILTEVI